MNVGIGVDCSISVGVAMWKTCAVSWVSLECIVRAATTITVFRIRYLRAPWPLVTICSIEAMPLKGPLLQNITASTMTAPIPPEPVSVPERQRETRWFSGDL